MRFVKRRTDRLLKLAEYLEAVPPGSFDYERVVTDPGRLVGIDDKERDAAALLIDSNVKQIRKCGYVGCAIGFLPFAFPRDFALRESNAELVVSHRKTGVTDLNAAEAFFGLPEVELSHLFIPGLQHPHDFGGVKLGPNATPKQVAKNIQEFVANLQAQK